MTAHRSRSRIAAWLALAGMALNASWPLLANAAPRVPALASEICSAAGLRHAGGGAPADSPDKSIRPAHCTLCSFNPERGAAIASAAGAVFAPAPAAAREPEFFETLHLQPAFDPTAPPRAPPLFS